MLSGDWTSVLKLHTILRPAILRENVHACIRPSGSISFTVIQVIV